LISLLLQKKLGNLKLHSSPQALDWETPSLHFLQLKHQINWPLLGAKSYSNQNIKAISFSPARLRRERSSVQNRLAPSSLRAIQAQQWAAPLLLVPA